jgi:hypothetical protein
MRNSSGLNSSTLDMLNTSSFLDADLNVDAQIQINSRAEVPVLKLFESIPPRRPNCIDSTVCEVTSQ